MFPVLAMAVTMAVAQLAVFNPLAVIEKRSERVFKPESPFPIALSSRSKQSTDANRDEIDRLLADGYDQMVAEDFEGAIATYQTALTLTQTQANPLDPLADPLADPLSNPLAELQGEALSGLGSAYARSGDYAAALSPLRSALTIFESLSAQSNPRFDPNRPAIFDPNQPAIADYAAVLLYLNGTLGVVNYQLANFATALNYYRRTLVNQPESNPLSLQAQVEMLHNIGGVETEIGQYSEAEATIRQAMSFDIDNPVLAGSLVFSLGRVEELQAKYDPALRSYQTALDFFQRSRSADRTIRTLNNLGTVHLKQGDFTAAKAAFDQGFTLLNQQDDPLERAALLDSLGSLYRESKQADQAWSAHWQALQLSQRNGYKTPEIEVLLNLGKLMAQQQQPNLAIFFYKQAIARIETIRQDLQQLSLSVQQQHTQTIAAFYRDTADLLLQQNRTAEALQILDLLKLQEINDYLHSSQPNNGAAASPQTASPQTASPQTASPQTDGSQINGSQTNEMPVTSVQTNDSINDSIQTNRFNTASETALANSLNNLPENISFAEFVALPAAVALSDSSISENQSLFDLNEIASLRTSLAAQPMTSAVLYPLILKDRLEILLITPKGEVKRFTTDVSKVDLTLAVSALQLSLTHRSTSIEDVEAPAQQLYDWLIRPIESTLAAEKVENIIYLPDGVLRYVPLAALRNRQHWLAETYQSHNITAATVDDLTERNSLPLSVLAGGLINRDRTYRVQVGAQEFIYHGLSAAKQEIENLITAIPNTIALLDTDFTQQQTLGSVENRRVIHLATHAKFVPGQPEESFILFGDGSTVNMRDIRQWTLPNVDLVVFSACQTASSAVESGHDGQEILGLGFQVQKTGAKSAIASLWSVDDTATAALMNQFYIALSQGQTKAQALRQAQLKMIRSEGFNDPRDWSAFILIGNGL
ncbi:MAG: hypothetical protein DCF15_14470 [Phormidesmis priestleyi]|uniref:CHAT domain-containing protein n=1 Tax=Phormidesmis priestleyi TaxID=268141 RepID=A0A2W4X582_9CYAN|nr:MAG: hypothetical protein DCF15_14470 [Phormidesmis priestleyi]